MMSRVVFAVTVGLVLIPAMISVPAFAFITLDGYIGDWGLTPFSDFAPISSTADVVWGDDTNNGPLPFTEYWDIEGMGVDNYHDSQTGKDYLAFFIQTSKSQSSGWGDLAIDVDGDGQYEYGADLTYFCPDGKAHNREFERVSKWRTIFGIEGKIKKSETIGSFEVVQRYLGKIEPDECGWKARTYIIEGLIDLSLLGPLPDDCEIPIQLLYAKVSCLRDYLILNGDIDNPCPGVIPEPATMLLFGSGLLGLAGVRFKKKKVL